MAMLNNQMVYLHGGSFYGKPSPPGPRSRLPETFLGDAPSNFGQHLAKRHWGTMAMADHLGPEIKPKSQEFMI